MTTSIIFPIGESSLTRSLTRKRSSMAASLMRVNIGGSELHANQLNLCGASVNFRLGRSYPY